MSSLSSKLQQKLNLKRYLEELGALTGRVVQADELCSLEQVVVMRQAAKKLAAQHAVVFEIPFSDKDSNRFKAFIQKLKDADSSPVYLWTPRTINCGALLVPSVAEIKFDFDFAINDEGIISFTTIDFRDSLLLDFTNTPMGAQCMRVETQGENWTKVSY